MIQQLHPASPVSFSPLILSKKEEGEESSLQSFPSYYPGHRAHTTHKPVFIFVNFCEIPFPSLWITHTIYLQSLVTIPPEAQFYLFIATDVLTYEVV